MSKVKSIYVCPRCDTTSSKWQGQCPGCGEWNTLVETLAEKTTSRYQGLASASKLQPLAAVKVQDTPRISTCNPEFDRVLGGGLVPGGVVLIGGDPGIGKSTLLLQTLCDMASAEQVIYVTGEESVEQVALRAQRLAVPTGKVDLLAEILLEKILATLSAEKPTVAVIDSIQTIYTDALSSAPGSVAQVRECSAQLTRLAKSTGITLILVGHVTKEGTLAGPRVLEHIVDTVLYFEGDTHSNFRLIRAFKNRFGAVNELGVFAMTDRGLKGVSNPSAMFLSGHKTPVPGACVLVTQEGTRPLLVEIQALVDDAHGNPRRLGSGVDQSRLSLLLAVLHRHAGLALFDQDVFINAVGGVRVAEPAADLAVLVAIISSYKNKPLRDKLVVFGEIGLAGELRPVQRGQERLREAAKLGFEVAIIPLANAPKQEIEGLKVFAISRLEEVLSYLFD